MKNTKKIISVVLAVIMALSVLSICAFAADKFVQLRIEGVKECLFYDTLKLDDGDTVYNILMDADQISEDIAVTCTVSEYGAYLYAINEDASGQFGSWDGWMFMVNGVNPTMGIDAYKLKPGDKIVIYYSDQYKAGMQFPELSYKNGVITAMSADSVYDDEGKEIVTVNPVADATITYIDGGKTITLTTDANGKATVPEANRTLGYHSVQIEKYASNGLPLVLRLEPDYELEVTETQVSFIRRILDRLFEFYQRVLEIIQSLAGDLF